MTETVTQCWWVRHAIIAESGRYIGHTDVPAVVPAYDAAELSLQLPGNDALWFSSPLLRSVQTAKWLMHSCKVDEEKLGIVAEIKEQHFGAWENKTYDEVWQKAEAKHDWSKPEALRPDGGESFTDVCARTDVWLDALLTAQAGRPIVIVTHAGVIRAGLRHALGITPAQALLFQADYGGISQTVYYSGETDSGKKPAARVNYVNRG